jgi:hypothetical protein
MVRSDRKLNAALARKWRLAGCDQAAFRAVLDRLAVRSRWRLARAGGHGMHGVPDMDTQRGHEFVDLCADLGHQRQGGPAEQGRRARHSATRRHDMWCSESRRVPYMVLHAAGSAGPGARGGKRESGVNPGLPRSGERERQSSESCAQARGGNSTGPDQPGKRRPVGGVNGDAAPVSPKTCQRAARDTVRGGSGRAGRLTSTVAAGIRLRRAPSSSRARGPGLRSELARRER